MKALKTYLPMLAGVACLLGQVSLAEVDTEAFDRAYRHSVQNPDWIPETGAPENVKFVFIGGLAGEADSLYFKSAATELRKLTKTSGEKDPARARVFVIKPSSLLEMEPGEQYLHDKLTEILEASPQGTKLRLIGHSLGGFRLWSYLNHHPEILAHVDAAVHVQTPFGGSPLAQFILEGRPVSEVVPFWQNPARHIAYRGLMGGFGLFKPSLRILVPEYAQRHVEALDTSAGRAREDLLGRSLFVGTSKEPYGGWRAFIPGEAQLMNICAKALNHLSPGPNDGLVKLAHQFPPRSQTRSLRYENLHHRSLMTYLKDGKPFARALWTLRGAEP